MDYSTLSTEELENVRVIVNAEINKRYKAKREKREEELIKLLNRVNELQDKYGFEISCEECDGSWIESASNFGFMR